jgi:hypothetical protein
MLVQATSSIIIKMTNEREKQLFDELLSTGIIQDWSNKLKIEIIKKERSATSIEIRALQIQQGQLMRQIDDYYDTFDRTFRVLELKLTIVYFFRRKKQADNQFRTLADTWNNWGWQVKYLSKIEYIIIYPQPTSHLSFIDSYQTEVKQLLTKLPTDGNLTRDQQKCVFCGTNVLFDQYIVSMWSCLLSMCLNSFDKHNSITMS